MDNFDSSFGPLVEKLENPCVPTGCEEPPFVVQVANVILLPMIAAVLILACLCGVVIAFFDSD